MIHPQNVKIFTAIYEARVAELETLLETPIANRSDIFEDCLAFSLQARQAKDLLCMPFKNKKPTITSTIAPRSTPIAPVFIRLPRQGEVCPHSGLSRAFMYQLISEGKIRSISLRDKGKSRGVRLVRYESLMDFLNSQESNESSTGE